MNNPLALWTSWLSAGRMVGETMDAAQAVISSRSETIAAATRNPMKADVAELGLMVSEKNKAFAKAGESLASDWSRMQGDLMAQAEAFGSLWMGDPLMPGKAMAIMARSQRINERAMASGIRALKPIHATATANKRRLAPKP
ncbi:MAG: hypothetical protein ABIR77_00300 [Sphingomicrobium sp.]